MLDTAQDTVIDSLWKKMDLAPRVHMVATPGSNLITIFLSLFYVFFFSVFNLLVLLFCTELHAVINCTTERGKKLLHKTFCFSLCTSYYTWYWHGICDYMWFPSFTPNLICLNSSFCPCGYQDTTCLAMISSHVSVKWWMDWLTLRFSNRALVVSSVLL